MEKIKVYFMGCVIALICFGSLCSMESTPSEKKKYEWQWLNDIAFELLRENAKGRVTITLKGFGKITFVCEEFQVNVLSGKFSIIKYMMIPISRDPLIIHGADLA